MEGIFRKYSGCLAVRKNVVVPIFALFLLLCKVNLKGQISDQQTLFFIVNTEYKEIINQLESFDTSNIDIDQWISNKLGNTTFSIHPNAVIEYDRKQGNKGDIVIKDYFVPFLINRLANKIGKAEINCLCLEKSKNKFYVFYESQNVISNEVQLRKAIFQKIDEIFEMRRISFADQIPPSCRNAETDSLVESIPQIELISQYLNQHEAIIYGRVSPLQPNGRLINELHNLEVNVNPNDGIFVMRIKLTDQSYFQLLLKYEYDRKFVRVNKLLVVK